MRANFLNTKESKHKVNTKESKLAKKEEANAYYASYDSGFCVVSAAMQLLNACVH